MNLGHTVQLITSSVCSEDRSSGVAIGAEQKPVQERQRGGRADPHFALRVLFHAWCSQAKLFP